MFSLVLRLPEHGGQVGLWEVGQGLSPASAPPPPLMKDKRFGDGSSESQRRSLRTEPHLPVRVGENLLDLAALRLAWQRRALLQKTQDVKPGRRLRGRGGTTLVSHQVLWVRRFVLAFAAGCQPLVRLPAGPRGGQGRGGGEARRRRPPQAALHPG